MEKIKDMEKRATLPLNINFLELFGSWSKVLQPIFGTNYFYNLLTFIEMRYRNQILNSVRVYPQNKDKIFDVFKNVNYNKLSVVIIKSVPTLSYSNFYSINKLSPYGIAVTDQDTTKFKHAIQDTIIDEDDTKYKFDTTLTRWSSQGVAVLPVSLTTEVIAGTNAIYMNHEVVWNYFMKNFLYLVSENMRKKKKPIIFVFWGNEANKFRNQIDNSYHMVIQYKDPKEGNLAKWNCKSFKQISRIRSRYLNEEPIIW